MTREELRLLCQTLRAEGVSRVQLRADGAPELVEFFAAAAAIPTDEERASAAGSRAAPEGSDTSGFERAIGLVQQPVGAAGQGKA